METVLGARSGTAYGDGWVRSTCTICMNRCGILAHVNDDGVVDKILGDPDNPHNGGRTCAKGDAGFEGLTDGDRITTPLRQFSLEARTQRVWDINHALWFTLMGLGGGVFLAGRILNLTDGLGSLLGIPTVAQR